MLQEFIKGYRKLQKDFENDPYFDTFWLTNQIDNLVDRYEI